MPSDLLIFAPPSWSMPVCIHHDTNGRSPVAPSDCARSASWWGKARSPPPPWISNLVAEVRHRHRANTRCASRDARTPRRLPRGLVGQRALPEHEVERIALPGHVRHVAALVGDREHLVPRHVRDLAEGRIGRDAEVDLAVGPYASPASSSFSMSAIICGTCWVARGRWSGGSQLRPAISVRKVVTQRLPRAR